MFYNSDSIAESAQELRKLLQEFTGSPSTGQPVKILSIVQTIRLSLDPEKDKIAALYVQGIEKLTSYLQVSLDAAHPNASTVLLSFGQHFAEYYANTSHTAEQKRQILLRDVSEFTKLKSELAKTSVSPATTPINSPAVKDARRDLRIVILSLDWEVGDEVLQTFERTLKTLSGIFVNDQIITGFLRGLFEIQEYLCTSRAKAHPETFKILQAFHSSLDTSLEPETTISTKKALLVDRLKEFGTFKKHLSEFNSEPTKTEELVDMPAALPNSGAEVSTIQSSNPEIDNHVSGFFNDDDDATSPALAPEPVAASAPTPAAPAAPAKPRRQVVAPSLSPQPIETIPGIVDNPEEVFDDDLEYDGVSEVEAALSGPETDSPESTVFHAEDDIQDDLHGFFGDFAEDSGEISRNASESSEVSLTLDEVDDSAGMVSPAASTGPADHSEFEAIEPAFGAPAESEVTAPVAAASTVAEIEDEIEFDFSDDDAPVALAPETNPLDGVNVEDNTDDGEYEDLGISPALVNEDATSSTYAGSADDDAADETSAALNKLFDDGTDDAPTAEVSIEKPVVEVSEEAVAPVEEIAVTSTESDTGYMELVDAAWNDQDAFKSIITARIEAAADEESDALLKTLEVAVALGATSEGYRDAADALAMALDDDNDSTLIAVAFSKFAVTAMSASLNPSAAPASAETTETIQQAIKLLQSIQQ